MLDAILSPEWEYRYHSFNSKWAKDEQLGSMRNGQGDDFYALFNRHGCFLKGFAHESPMTPHRQRPPRVWEGVLEGVPAEFADCLREPAFNLEETTFCIWRRYGDAAWQRGNIQFPAGDGPDGSRALLSLLDGKPETYRAWALDYYEMPSLPLGAVRHVCERRPLTPE